MANMMRIHRILGPLGVLESVDAIASFNMGSTPKAETQQVPWNKHFFVKQW
jgi:hypothetical protein